MFNQTASDVNSVYLNMAGAGRISNNSLARISDYQRLEQKIGAYEAETIYRYLLESRIYETIARLLGSSASDIAIFDSATRAWIEVVRRTNLTQPGTLITTPYEYAGNLQVLHELARRYGHSIETIPLGSDDELDLDWLRNAMTDQVRLISIVHIPSNCGIVNPVEDIGQIVAPYDAVYVIDACQSVGQRDINVVDIGCDALTAAGRKFLAGPRGTGFAYVSPKLRKRLNPGYVDLHCSRFMPNGSLELDLATARSLELSERNCAALAGLEQAIAGGGASTLKACSEAFQLLREEIAQIAGIDTVNPGRDQGCIFTFRHASVPASEVVQRLDRHRITAWRIDGAHTPLYMLPRGIAEAVRLSSNNLSLAGAERAVAALRDLLTA